LKHSDRYGANRRGDHFGGGGTQDLSSRKLPESAGMAGLTGGKVDAGGPKIGGAGFIRGRDVVEVLHREA